MTKKVVTIGGGTGSFVLLKGLKNHPLNLTAVVCVTDSGGSTGRLRTEFGFLPVGDFRQCLAALAKDGQQEYIRKLLLYRFSKGKGLKGHNLGNLILTALTDMVGTEQQAIATASEIFQLKGTVLPVSLDDVDLVAEYQDGTVIKGEHEIDEPAHQGGKRIISLTTEPEAEIYQQTKKAIIAADLIVIGPGDIYTSILPNFIVKGFKKAVNESKAKIVYVLNLMNRYSQTPEFKASEYIDEIESYLGSTIDYVVVNSQKIPKKILHKYKKKKSYPVKDDLSKKAEKVLRMPLLKEKMVEKKAGDSLERSFLRHDSNNLANTIMSLFNEHENRE